MFLIWDEKLAEYGEKVSKYRQDMIEKIKKLIIKNKIKN